MSNATVLLAEQTFLNAMVARVQAEAMRYADTAALFQALGGGWWNRPHELDRVDNVAQAKPLNIDLYPGPRQAVKAQDYLVAAPR